MVAPIATMPGLTEGLHGWEQMGLKSLANSNNVGGDGAMTGALDALKAMMAGNPNFLNKSAAATDAGMAPVTGAQISDVANPYAQGINDNLSKAAEKIRAQITAGQGVRGARSFGDTATGVQNAMLDDSILTNQNTNNYNTWNAAREQVNADRNRSLQGASQYGNLANTGLAAINDMFGLGERLKTSRLNDVTNKLYAGKYIRDYNQGVNDKLANDITARQNFPIDSAAKIMELLKGFESQGTYTTPGKTSTASKIGGILGSFGI